MKTSILKCLAWILPLLPLRGVSQDKSIVQFEWSCVDNAKPGDTITAMVIIAVASGWHVYAPVEINRIQQMQLTQVRFMPLPPGLTAAGAMELPLGKQKGPHVVYEGKDNRFVQRFVVDRAVKGEIRIQGKLNYQACNQATCFPPVTERFETTIRISASAGSESPRLSGLPSKDSAKARVQQAWVMFASDAEYEAYTKLPPLQLKQFEDNQAKRQVEAALWYCKNYPIDSDYVKVLSLYLKADPMFIDSISGARLDTVTHYKGMNWIAFMRSLPIDVFARNNWLQQGDSMVAALLSDQQIAGYKENLEFLLFARDYRLNSRQYSFLPREQNEASYWSLLEKTYWNPMFERFQQHCRQYADLPVVAERAQDFLASLKSRSPDAAARYWKLLNQLSERDRLLAGKKGISALRDTARGQLNALEIERGEKPLMMTFTGLDGKKFDINMHKGKIVVVDFWASWCQPCVAELPHLRSLYEKYKGQGLQVVGICLDEESLLPKVKSIIKKNKVDWPQRFEGKGFQNDTYRLLYGISALPTVWVLNRSGNIVSTSTRGPQLETLISQLLRD